MAGDIELFGSDLTARSVADLKPFDEGVGAFTEQEALKLTEMARTATARLDQLVTTMYLGKIHLVLGYDSWAEYCKEEELTLEFRPSLELRREMHYEMYWLHGMSGRSVGAFSNCDQKTVMADAKQRHLDLLAAGQESPERRHNETDSLGRPRGLREKAEPAPAETEVQIETSVQDLVSAVEDEDIIDIEEVRPPAAAAPLPPQQRAAPTSKPEVDWPTLFRDSTVEMRAAMGRARRVMTHHRLPANLPGVASGLIGEWEGWASEMVDWTVVLTDTPQD